MPSKAKTKPQRREPAGPSTKFIPIWERIWTDVEPGDYSISDYEVSKKLIHLLRHGRQHREMMKQLNSGETTTIFKNISCVVIIRLTTSGRKPWQEDEETKKNIPVLY